MNVLKPIKLCYRCDAPVHTERTDENEFAREFTCCVACRAKLKVEAERIGQPLSQTEASTSTPRKAVSDNE